ncbi:MAG TPA: hypothetical protein DCS20_04150 [Candidatus Yonathbacteria bacterium]|nr:hypothetical protein [Candidatus Yonathbacteria bacterium]
MEIILPKACSGKQILEIFARAATFDIQPERRWDAFETLEEGGLVVIPTFVRRDAVFTKKGLDIILSTKKKRWVFFGKYVWKPESSPVIRLEPLELEVLHKSVEVSVMHTFLKKGKECLVQDANDPHFAEFWPHYQATIRRLLGRIADPAY